MAKGKKSAKGGKGVSKKEKPVMAGKAGKC